MNGAALFEGHIVRGTFKEKTVDNIRKFNQRFMNMYSECQVVAVSAALSFYITLTFFPMMICLYTLLGNNVDRLSKSLDVLSNFIAADSVALIREFMGYISSNSRPAMLVAGIILMMTFSSAAIRQFQNYVGTMQGGRRFNGLSFYLFSFFFSLILLAVVYFSILVTLSGDWVLEWINEKLPFIYIPFSWKTVRFPVLGLVFFLSVQILYSASKRSIDLYHTFLGSLICTVSIVIISILFSAFINKSVRYPLVYGSLTAIVLFMLWLYYVCTAVCCGALVNIVVRDMRMEKLREEYDDIDLL